MNCQAWDGITVNGRRPHCQPAVAWWRHPHGGTSRLCQNCLDAWFDNADDDETLEPAAWCWLTPQAA